MNQFQTVKGDFDTIDIQSRRIRFLSAFFTVLALGFLALAALLVPLFFVSFEKAKAFFDWCVAAHGIPGNYITHFIEAYNSRLESIPIVSGAFGVCAITLALFKEKLARFLLEIPAEWPGVRNSFRSQFQGGAGTVVEVSAVILVFAAGIFLRIRHLGRAVRFDEAWTYMEFASRPLVVAVSNYHVPNNHLLHTVLVHFSTRLFGHTLFGLRFPAFVIGCLVILVSWFVTRALYGQLAGILAAGCVAALPTFIEFSVNSRGYALQWLFILIAIWLAATLVKNPSSRIGWLGFVLAGVAGVFTIPTTLIALAGIFAWMLVATLAVGESGRIRDLSASAARAGLAIGLLSTLLYVPALLARGPQFLMAKKDVAWQQRDFTGGLVGMVQCVWIEWTAGVPAGVLWVLLGGFAIGLAFSRRIGGRLASLSIALWLSSGLFILVRHVFAYPRVWSYLLLSVVMTACGGLSLVLAWLAGQSPLRRVALAGVVSVGLAVLVSAGVIKQRVLFTSIETGRILDADQIVDFLMGELRPGDFLETNSLIEYELLRRNPKLFYSLTKNPEEAHRVLAVVAKSVSGGGVGEMCRPEELTASWAAQETADPARLATELDLQPYMPPQVRAKFLSSTVFSFERRQR